MSTLALALPLLISLTAHGGADSLSSFRGETGQFVEVVPKRQAPDVAFFDGTGAQRRLSEFRGRTLIINYWATWCPPCVREMPALDRLQRDLGDSGVAVLPISLDKPGAGAVTSFYRAYNLRNLAVLVDPMRQTIATKQSLAAGNPGFKLMGLPVTYFVDPTGAVVGYINGSVNWDAGEPRRFIAHLKNWKE